MKTAGTQWTPSSQTSKSASSRLKFATLKCGGGALSRRPSEEGFHAQLYAVRLEDDLQLSAPSGSAPAAEIQAPGQPTACDLVKKRYDLMSHLGHSDVTQYLLQS